ncbi:Hypothetical Protein FCC1311_020712 [Hondaea fermentalgiana]|uniref:Uncharacterized protein n=1 Tax=Hondaea fermentalgiana TaxID=2315210 RepID=A0A2R5G496_9STRA|nr:Hypothetical Protein FCC1311_020712 [Hondaea fermentalgiana]|eukprot:GBG25852.1 Hypothetical Protein FCC1311_020712 [Hondaea fermentalgiana]
MRWRKPKPLTNAYVDLIPPGFETHPVFAKISEAVGAGYVRRARVLGEEFLAQNPGDSVESDIGRIILSRLLLQLGRPDKAHVVMQGVRDLMNQKNADMAEILGEIATQKGNWATAAFQFECASEYLARNLPPNVQRFAYREEAGSKRVLREHVFAARQANALRHIPSQVTKATQILQRLLVKERNGNDNAKALETYGNVVIATGLFGDGFKLKIQALTAEPLNMALCERVADDMRKNPHACADVIDEVLKSTMQLPSSSSATSFIAEVARKFGVLDVAEGVFEHAMLTTPGRIQVFRAKVGVLELRAKYVHLLQQAFDFFDGQTVESEAAGKPFPTPYMGVREVISRALSFALADGAPGPRTRNTYAYKLKPVPQKDALGSATAIVVWRYGIAVMDTAIADPNEISDVVDAAAMASAFTLRDCHAAPLVLPQRHPGAFPSGDLDSEDYKTTKRPPELTEDDMAHAANRPPFSLGQTYFLSSLFLVIKSLFLLGPNFIRFIPALMAWVEPVRVMALEIFSSEAYPEFACYEQISTVLPSLGRFMEPYSFRIPRRRVYMLGDNHVLSAAWQEGSAGGKPYLFEPRVSSGLRCWSLRNGSKHPSRAQFEELIKLIPDGSVVIFCFGDMDCREGLLNSVRKDEHESVLDAIETCVTFYITKMIQLSRKNGFIPLVHPVPPATPVVRPLVDKFNAVLQEKVLHYSKYLTWIDILPSLLTTDPLPQTPETTANGRDNKVEVDGDSGSTRDNGDAKDSAKAPPSSDAANSSKSTSQALSSADKKKKSTSVDANNDADGNADDANGDGNEDEAEDSDSSDILEEEEPLCFSYNGTRFKHEEYGLNGVHLHPCYSKLLEKAIEPKLVELLDAGKFQDPPPRSPLNWRKWKQRELQRKKKHANGQQKPTSTKPTST